MKKTTYLICIPFLGLACASCQKDNVAEPISPKEAIVFSARTLETKGQPQLNVLEELALQDFSVSAWYSKNEKSFGEDSKHYISNHRFGTLDTQISASTQWQGIARNSNGDKSPDPVYYPLDGSLSFFCYAPYRDKDEFSDILIKNDPDESITSRLTNYLPNSPLIQFTPEENVANQIDFVVADPVLDWKKEDGDIVLDFTKHLTTNLRFLCKYSGSVNAESERIIIKTIWIQNVIGSEFLYFTKEGDALGHQWSSTVSPDGTGSMPPRSYVLSIENNSLKDRTFLSDTDFTYINYETTGQLYLLPQAFPDRTPTMDPASDPQLHITYEIWDNQNNPIETNTLKFDLRGTEPWPMGKTLAYEITIGVAERKNLNIIKAVIVDWTNAENNHQQEEILY